MKFCAFNSQNIALILFFLYTLQFAITISMYNGYSPSEENNYWANSMKSKYLPRKFFPFLPLFYPAKRNPRVSTTYVIMN